MHVILLERVEKLGQMGDEVKVKDGFARNYLLPKKKALRATKANREYFQTQKAQLEARNLERKKDAEAVAKKLEGKVFVLLRQAGDRGQLYGSVSPRDIADLISEGGFSISRRRRREARSLKLLSRKVQRARSTGRARFSFHHRTIASRSR
jgi:large subunit ribosomal protein L9